MTTAVKKPRKPLPPDQRERARQRSNAWAAANREIARERARQWYEANKERAKEANAARHAERLANDPSYREQRRRAYLQKREEIRAAARALPSDHPLREIARQRTKKWNEQNAERKKARDTAYYEANGERVKRRVREYRAENAAAVKAREGVRRIKRALRVPKWLTDDDWATIERFYAEALAKTAETGEEWQVDHVIPLCGRYVSGLHVPSNLQVITAAENMKKKNKFTPWWLHA